MNLDYKILAALKKRPMAYPEIETAVGVQPDFQLGITLARMVADYRIIYTEGKTFEHTWPVYSIDRLPKGFKKPARQDLLPNERVPYTTAMATGDEHEV